MLSKSTLKGQLEELEELANAVAGELDNGADLDGVLLAEAVVEADRLQARLKKLFGRLADGSGTNGKTAKGKAKK